MKRIAAVTLFFAVAVVVPAWLPAQDATQSVQKPAQEPTPQHFYRLNLVVKELNGDSKVVNTRNYFMTVGTATRFAADTQIIKTGSRVPIATGSYESSKLSPLTNTQFQYIDLGVSFDVRQVEERGDSIHFALRAQISSIARQTEIAGVGEPVIRQNSWDSSVVVPIGKPTVVGSSDDLDSKGKMQIEVTATRID